MAAFYIFALRSRQLRTLTAGPCIVPNDRHIAVAQKGGPARIEGKADMSADWSERARRPDIAAALAIFVLSFATLLGVWFFQFVLKLPPCPLCLEQRVPYYVVIPLSFLVILAALARARRKLLAAGFLIILAAMLWSAALGTYHAGVEWRFWAGPADCSGPMTDFTTKGPLLNQLQSIQLVRCDEAAWRFLGISLAGYNVLVSLMLAGIAACGLLARERKS